MGYFDDGQVFTLFSFRLLIELCYRFEGKSNTEKKKKKKKEKLVLI